MRTPVIAVCIGVLAALPASAFERVTKKTDFMASVKDVTLVHPMGITLLVSEDGAITGRGLGRNVSGAWEWRDGFFCRSLYWGKRDLGDNCQTVDRVGSKLRFTSDKGQGDSADFRLRRK